MERSAVPAHRHHRHERRQIAGVFVYEDEQPSRSAAGPSHLRKSWSWLSFRDHPSRRPPPAASSGWGLSSRRNL